MPSFFSSLALNLGQDNKSFRQMWSALQKEKKSVKGQQIFEKSSNKTKNQFFSSSLSK